jgi:hypothetical protein
VVDGGFVAVSQVEESTDFGEGECDQASVDGWGGFWFDWLVRRVLVV